MRNVVPERNLPEGLHLAITKALSTRYYRAMIASAGLNRKDRSGRNFDIARMG
jgi:hypothetical protein